MQQLVASKIGAAIDALIKGRMTVDQLPRFAFRNLKDDGINHILGLGAQGFGALVRNVVLSKGLPQSYLERPDIQYGFVWVFEEIARLALLSNWLEQHGRLAERQKLLDWAMPTVIPWNAEQPIVGDEAAELFASSYPDVTAGDLDMPPAPPPQQQSMHAPIPKQQPAAPARKPQPRPQPQQAPLRVVREPAPEPEAEPDFVPVDPFAGNNGNGQHQPAPRANPAPRRATPSEPDFA